MPKQELSRRGFLGMIGAVGASSLFTLGDASRAQTKSKSIRIVHMTDLHIKPENGAEKGVALALEHVNKLERKPDAIITGGDLIFDSLGATRTRTRNLWSIYNKAFRDHNDLPVYHCLGNHDVWGWDKKASETSGTEMLYGKKFAQEMLNLRSPDQFFDVGNWRFIILDSIQPSDSALYEGGLTPEQMSWLESTLKSTPKNKFVHITTHIPIFAISPLFDAQHKERRFSMSISTVMRDGPALKKLFQQYPNVKICQSGHTHLIDRIDYLGVSYLNSGAVSGNWWAGKLKEFDPGYTIMDLNDDGSFTQKYQPWGWTQDLAKV